MGLSFSIKPVDIHAHITTRITEVDLVNPSTINLSSNLENISFSKEKENKKSLVIPPTPRTRSHRTPEIKEPADIITIKTKDTTDA